MIYEFSLLASAINIQSAYHPRNLLSVALSCLLFNLKCQLAVAVILLMYLDDILSLIKPVAKIQKIKRSFFGVCLFPYIPQVGKLRPLGQIRPS